MAEVTPRFIGARRSPIFYGWVIVAVSALTMAAGYGVRNSFSRLFLVMVEDFGWSRAVASGIFSVNVLTYGLAAPWVGALTDRLGPRKVLPAGGLLLGLAVLLASRGNSLWQFYPLWMLIALGVCLVGYVPHSVVLANWFVRRRGAALGLFGMGFGLSFFSPFLTQLLISSFGWRTAYLFWGLAALGIIVPLALLFQRRRPQDMGLAPDGQALPLGETSHSIADPQATSVPAEKLRFSAEAPPPQGGGGNLVKKSHGTFSPETILVDGQWAATEWTLGQALRQYRFWALFLASFFMWGIAFILMLLHMVALVVDVGYSELFATLIFALYGAMSALGPLGGFISDRIGREVTATLGSSLMILGVVILLLVRDTSHPWLLYLFAVAFGLGTGLNSPAINAMAADLFQGRNFGSINGFIVAGFGLGGALGSYLGGLIHDLTGSYDLALLAVIAAIIVAVSLFWVAAPRKVRPVARQARPPGHPLPMG